MGKKHKKHKSEKHGYEEYGERPLKLVLKVAGNEVTAGSSSFDKFYDEQSADYDKPKEKKKKKKKRDDKERGFGSPDDDKGKKKMTKKRKCQDAEGEWDDSNKTPIRSELDKLEQKEQTPLQEALNQLIRQLQRKDPSAFFSFPVTDFIAPGYSSVIKRAMDFSTMKNKVKKEWYQSLDELKVDFRLMCENAMIYNKTETIYHRAAKKLLHSGMKILSPERLQSLRQSIEFMSGLDPLAIKPGKTEEEGGASLDQIRDGPGSFYASESSQSPSTPRQDKESKEEARRAEKDLEDIRRVVEESGGKLTNRPLQSELDFWRRKSDGSTTLAILNPADPAAGEPGYCQVKLGMMSNRLQNGVNSLQGFREDKRNRITPVSYINHGPFTSYAPTYDSSFANVSKEDSDLIYSFYGEEPGPRGPESMSEFLAKSEEYTYKLADNLLDAMTRGEHSKSLADMERLEEQTKTHESTDAMQLADPEAGAGSRRSSLSSVMSPEPVPQEHSHEAQLFQEKLDETTKLLRELQEVQRERLSSKQPPSVICLLAPTAKELQLAEKVTENLTKLTSQVAPGDVSSVYGIRRAMGVCLPSEPSGPLVDLTTVQEMAESMDTFSGDQEAMAVFAV